MADIARLAGVSVSAVSLALRDSPMIGEQTKKRIVELARSLNYRVNARAQGLRTRSNRTVAVVVPYSNSDRHHLFDPFYLGLVGSIADALINQGYQMLLSRADEHGEDLAALYETGQAVGVILTAASRQHDQCNRLAMAGVPLVVWGAPMEQQLYCTVGSDNTQGGRIAIEHLLDGGARRIAFVGDRLLPEGAQRYVGYSQALQARGIAMKDALHLPLTGGGTMAELQQEIGALLQREPALDAVFASGDMLAIDTIKTLIEAGKRVPQDVAVIGFDDIDRAAYVQPPLSTVRQPITAVGVAMVEALGAQLAGEPPRSQQLPTTLVVRATTRSRT